LVRSADNAGISLMAIENRSVTPAGHDALG
jgi:hypothetical protein